MAGGAACACGRSDAANTENNARSHCARPLFSVPLHPTLSREPLAFSPLLRVQLPCVYVCVHHVCRYIYIPIHTKARVFTSLFQHLPFAAAFCILVLSSSDDLSGFHVYIGMRWEKAECARAALGESRREIAQDLLFPSPRARTAAYICS